MNIGKMKLPRTAALAPMAGVGDRAFRETCIEWGAGYVVGEMCSAKGYVYGSAKSAHLLYLAPEEQPAAVQLFGDDPDFIARAVERVMEEFSPQIIDLNMGCPAPKIAGDGCGAALLKNLPLAEKILRAAVEHSSVPVTVKIRKGWDAEHIVAVEFAQMAEACGIQAIAVHGRTKVQMYAPPVDLEIIAAVKRAVPIPVIGNGGITCAQDAQDMYQLTNCDMVMVGQGALGAPWIFRQIADYLESGIYSTEPSLETKLETLIKHAAKAVLYKGERIAMREMRTHAAWYIKGIHAAAQYRKQAGNLSTLEDLQRLCDEIVRCENGKTTGEL